MSKTQREILVRNLRLDRLAEDLPTSVFPITIDVALARSSGKDEYLLDNNGDQIRKPAYPFDVKLATRTPYVPGTTVYLENPAMFPKSNKPSWTFEAFADKLATIVKRIEAEDPTARDRLYLAGMQLAEVQDDDLVFVNDDGERRVDSDLYTDRGEMAIAEFEKRPRISDQKVREKLGAAAAGNVIKPLRLTNAKLVHAKEHRGTNQTTAESCRRKYFTKGQAEKYNEPQLGPKDVPNLTWGVIETYFNALATADDYQDKSLVAEVKFEGETRTTDQFNEDDVDFLHGHEVSGDD